MRPLTILLAASLPAAALAAPTLTLEGSCPGGADITISDITPGANLAFLATNLGVGDDAIPVGRCAGTETGLTGPRWLFTVPDGDMDGTIAFSPMLGDFLCDRHIQMLDTETCELTDIGQLSDMSVVSPPDGGGGAVGDPVSFSTCGADGQFGPDQPACDAAYAGTTLEGAVTVVPGGVQQWTVPSTGTYRITAVGAAGMAGDIDVTGGRGAEIAGDFDLVEGEVLELAVGQMGTTDFCDGGGGGGSFVVRGGEPLLVAGGGAGTRDSVIQNGCDAHIGESAGTGSSSLDSWDCGEKGIDLGFGGIVSGVSWGSAGAGFFGPGGLDSSYASFAAEGWPTFTGGAGSDTVGGFGGGGAGDGQCGGGGGGGYSGGDGGRLAGGGGSFNAGVNAEATAGVGTGLGYIDITPLGGDGGGGASCPLDDWLVGTPCNGVDFGGGCTPEETGYHFNGVFNQDGQDYACWWHTKNQAWNTDTSSNFYSLATNFGLPAGAGGSQWCYPRDSNPCDSGTCNTFGSYHDIGNVGAWGWCGGDPFTSGGHVCLPIDSDLAADCI